MHLLATTKCEIRYHNGPKSVFLESSSFHPQNFPNVHFRKHWVEINLYECNLAEAYSKPSNVR